MLAGGAAGALSGVVAVDGAGASPTATGSWTMYHGDAVGSGVSSGATSVDTSAPAWTSSQLDGDIYGEPLVSAGEVFVATEADTVYALATASGSVKWSTHLGTAVPAASLPCGDIGPTVGVTGTPVVDETRSEIFVVADELVGGGPAHVLVGLDTATGAIELTERVDPPGADPAALLQRTGLTLDAGHVVFGLGGNFGDCSTYRGRVVSVPETGGTPTYFTVDAAPGQSEGAVWMGGAAPTIDGRGNVWVSAGNGSVTSAAKPYDDSDSALELSPSMTLLQYFAPVTWPHDNADDIDMSMAPALLPDGQVVVAGKSDRVFLLDGGHLGGIGTQKAEVSSGCSDDIDGGSAMVGQTLYLPCRSGPVAVEVAASPPGLRVLWRARRGGGPPIVAGGLIWTIAGDGKLYGLDPTSGAVRQQASTEAPANHFSTPGSGGGLLLVASPTHVVAFATTSPPGATAASPPGTPSTAGGRATSTTAGPASQPSGAPSPVPAHCHTTTVTAVVVALVAAVVAVSGAAWWRRRRRRRRRRRTG